MEILDLIQENSSLKEQIRRLKKEKESISKVGMEKSDIIISLQEKIRKMESELKRYKDLLDAGEEFDYIGEESIENKVANEWKKAFSKCDKLVIKQLVINGMDFKTKD